jgi:hypothetical protein
MTFRFGGSACVNAMAFAAIVPGACRHPAQDQDRNQHQPFSTDIPHDFPFVDST